MSTVPLSAVQETQSCAGCGRPIFDAPDITSAIEANLQEIHNLRAHCSDLRFGLHDDIEVYITLIYFVIQVL